MLIKIIFNVIKGEQCNKGWADIVGLAVTCFFLCNNNIYCLLCMFELSGTQRRLWAPDRLKGTFYYRNFSTLPLVLGCSAEACRCTCRLLSTGTCMWWCPWHVGLVRAPTWAPGYYYLWTVRVGNHPHFTVPRVTQMQLLTRGSEGERGTV